MSSITWTIVVEYCDRETVANLRLISQNMRSTVKQSSVYYPVEPWNYYYLKYAICIPQHVREYSGKIRVDDTKYITMSFIEFQRYKSFNNQDIVVERRCGEERSILIKEWPNGIRNVIFIDYNITLGVSLKVKHKLTLKNVNIVFGQHTITYEKIIFNTTRIMDSVMFN